MPNAQGGLAEGAAGPGELIRRLGGLRADGGPTTLTVNGHACPPVEDEESYRLLRELVARLAMIEGVKEGVRYFEQGGEGFSWAEIHEEIRRTHGTPG